MSSLCLHAPTQWSRTNENGSTVQRHLSGLIGTASHPDMQKIRTGFFLNKLHWQFVKRIKSTKGWFGPHTYLRINKTLICNSLKLFYNWGEHLSHKKMQYNYSNKMFTRRAKPIQIIGDPDNLRPDKCRSTVNTGALYILLGTCR